MKDLKKLAAECEAELLSIGIHPGKINRWIVNTRAKCRWGQCVQYLPDLYNISIAERLLQDGVSDLAVKNTIIHELLHTVKGCHGHTGKWKILAQKVNLMLPQYNIKRTASCEEYGLDSASRSNRYVIQCTHCGQQYYRQRECKLTLHPEKFRCGICKHPLKSAK